MSTDARTELAAGNLILRRTLEARYSNSQVDASLMMYILNVSHIRKGFEKRKLLLSGYIIPKSNQRLMSTP